MNGSTCAKKIFYNLSCLSTTPLHEKPPLSVMQIKLHSAILVRHIGSAILKMQSLTPDLKLAT